MIARALRQGALLLVLALVPAALTGAVQLHWVPPAPPLAADEVTLAEAQSWGDAVLWVDARARPQYERAHIPNAILLNEDEWVRLVGPFLDAWEPEKTIVVYCDAGHCDASRAVAARIKTELGIESRVRVLQGGWGAWLQRK